MPALFLGIPVVLNLIVCATFGSSEEWSLPTNSTTRVCSLGSSNVKRYGSFEM